MSNETKTKVKGVADILFLLDATGSMQPNIDAVKDNIGAFLDFLATPGEGNDAALARFTGDRAHFRKTLEMLAKSVSASAAADALEA